jgi:tetratricopeptide (TPR) repeat protein
VSTQIALGDLYLNALNQPVKAVEAYRQALSLDDSHAGAHYAQGVALIRLNRGADAEKELKRAAALEANNPLPANMLGNLYAAMGRRQEALDAYQSALDIDPKLMAAHFGRGDVFAAQGYPEKAIVEYQAVVTAAPTNAQSHLRIGMQYQALQKWQEAEKAYLAAIDLEPKFALAYNNLAWMNAERKTQLDKALSWGQKAVNLAPGVIEYKDTLAWVYRARGEFKQAVQTLEDVIKAMPNNPVYRHHLGMIYAEQGDNAKAIKSLKQALALDKSFPGAQQANELLRKLEAK